MTTLVSGNKLQLLCTGAEYFPALLDQIATATSEIRIETYIFEADVIGRQVSGALCAAAKRGVVVHLMVDGFGAVKFDESLAPSLRECGVKIQIYRPESNNLALRRHRLRRLHRKLSVFDQRIAFVGGINIVDDAENPLHPPRFDYAVKVEGPLVARIHRAMVKVWDLVDWAASGMKRHGAGPNTSRPQNKQESFGIEIPGAESGNMSAGFLIRDNLRHRRDIEAAYLHALQNARSEVLIANAYFLPGAIFRRALLSAARRGVKVTLLLQGQIEYAMLHYATLALYARLMRSGVRIVEYRRSFLHAKVAVIDSKWATVGSSNLDPFSLLLAREANLVVEDERFAAELKASLESAMADGATEVQAREVRERSWLARVASELAYGAVRLLIGFSGYGRRRR
jgi:cardiolipin synthase A/B